MFYVQRLQRCFTLQCNLTLTTGREHRGNTELAGYIWDLKDSNIPYTITWDILGRAPSYNPVTKTCRLCTLEKFFLYFTTPGKQVSTNGRNYSHPVSTETDISFSPEEKRKSKTHTGRGPSTLYLSFFNPILPSYFSFQ